MKNFLIVSLALTELGYTPLSIRLDSGDLAALSIAAKALFALIGTQFGRDFSNLKIVASNDINEKSIRELKDNKHQIDMFGIGTNLVTCQAQPALGMVYKICEFKGTPHLKISEEPAKTTIAGSKSVIRAINADGSPAFDVLCMQQEYEQILNEPKNLSSVFDRISKE